MKPEFKEYNFVITVTITYPNKIKVTDRFVSKIFISVKGRIMTISPKLEGILYCVINYLFILLSFTFRFRTNGNSRLLFQALLCDEGLPQDFD